jgi:tetratricopeptide (TPR) repeat protein|tara:strand:+ start:89 stop:667 length:579 start_codon:yes stop_codon:yes gene_type:complete
MQLNKLHLSMRFYNFFISFFIIILFVYPVYSSQASKLNQLFFELKRNDNIKNADLLEKKIWAIWNKHPDNVKLTQKLEFGTELMYSGDYDYALIVFNNIINIDPNWSEAWNKRATLLYFMKKFKKSLTDIKKVLLIEDRHFGALSGQAQIYIQLQEYELAIDSLKKARDIHPTIRGNNLIEELGELIRNQSI